MQKIPFGNKSILSIILLMEINFYFVKGKRFLIGACLGKKLFKISCLSSLSAKSKLTVGVFFTLVESGWKMITVV